MIEIVFVSSSIYSLNTPHGVELGKDMYEQPAFCQEFPSD